MLILKENVFIALGGSPHREGFVLRQKIIDVIKEFELTIEIEEYFKVVGIENEEITFDEFCLLFVNPGSDSLFYTTYKSFKSVNYHMSYH